MLPKLHKRYSKAVLDEFRLSKTVKDQIIRGYTKFSLALDYIDTRN